MTRRVGFIGLGTMGKPMANNILKAGYPLIVYNRTRSKMAKFLHAGAEGADSPGELARRCDVVITMLSDSHAVEEVVLGPAGVLEGARSGFTLIDMSTISPRVTREIAHRLQVEDAHVLDAPVSGGEVGAIEGRLSIMVGGDKDVFEEFLALLQTVGKRVTHVGPNGMGQTVKLCNQIITQLTLLAVCEGLIFAAKAGADIHKALEAVGEGAAGSWQLTNRAPKILRRDFAPGFMVKLAQKDLRLILEVADELALPLPATSLLHHLYNTLEAQGLGDEGAQALVKSLEALAGVEVRC